MVQHEQQRGGIELAVLNRQRLEFAAPDVDVRQVAKPAARGLQHVVRAIDGNHRSTNGASAAAT